MATINQIIQNADGVKNEVDYGANTASRVGGVIKSLAEYTKEAGELIDEEFESIDDRIKEHIAQNKKDLQFLAASIETKQLKLKSGFNIKTINGQDVLGNGNLVVGGGEANVVEIGITLDESGIVTFEKTYEEIKEEHDKGNVLSFKVNNEICIHSYTIEEKVGGVGKVIVDSTNVTSNKTFFLDHTNYAYYSETNYATKGDVAELVEEIETKQEELSSGENIKTIEGQSVLGGGDLKINKRIVEMEFGSEDDVWNSQVMAHALIFCSNGLQASNYLGLNEGTRRIRSFSYMVANHQSNVPAQGNFYMCIARKEGSNWIVKGCSTNSVNIFDVPINDYATFYFNDVELSVSGDTYGVCAMVTPEKKSVGYNLGNTSNNWDMIRPRVKNGFTRETNKCIGEYGNWNDTVQVVHKIVFADEMPRLPHNATDNNVINVINGKSSFSPLSVKTINGQSLLGNGNINVGNSEIYYIHLTHDEASGTVTSTEGGDTIRNFLNARVQNREVAFSINFIGSETQSCQMITNEWCLRAISSGPHIGTVLFVYTTIDNRGIEYFIDTNGGCDFQFTQYQDKLVSGTNIKTINDRSVLGSGNLELATKEELDEIKLFKTPNVTIIGSPEINNGQVVSFANGHLQFPFLVDFKNKPFRIQFELTTPNKSIVAQENIFDSDFGLALAIRNNKFVFSASTDGQTWNKGEVVSDKTLLQSTTYLVKFVWESGVLSLDHSVDNGASWISDDIMQLSDQPYPKQIYIGVGENGGSVVNRFSGIINLNKASLFIDGTEVWRGMDDAGLSTRLATDLSNIDNAGVERIKSLAGGKFVVHATADYVEDTGEFLNITRTTPFEEMLSALDKGTVEMELVAGGETYHLIGLKQIGSGGDTRINFFGTSFISGNEIVTISSYSIGDNGYKFNLMGTKQFVVEIEGYMMSETNLAITRCSHLLYMIALAHLQGLHLSFKIFIENMGTLTTDTYTYLGNHQTANSICVTAWGELNGTPHFGMISIEQNERDSHGYMQRIWF